MKTPKDWKSLERHQLSNDYPNIDGDDWKKLVGSLRKHGIVGDRRVTMHDDKVIDGWQLLRACIEADVKPEFQLIPEGIEPESFVEIANDLRRHETPQAKQQRREQRVARIAEMRRNGQTTRAISTAENISQTQVQRDLKASVEPYGSTEPKKGKISGSDGKSYKAKKGKSKPKLRDDIDDSGAMLDSVNEPVPPGLVPVFNKVKSFREIINQLNEIGRSFDDLKKTSAGSAMNAQDGVVDLRNFKETVRFNMPFAVCPVCSGIPKTRKANCPCKQRGWLVETAYRSLPTELRK